MRKVLYPPQASKCGKVLGVKTIEPDFFRIERARFFFQMRKVYGFRPYEDGSYLFRSSCYIFLLNRSFNMTIVNLTWPNHLLLSVNQVKFTIGMLKDLFIKKNVKGTPKWIWKEPSPVRTEPVNFHHLKKETGSLNSKKNQVLSF